MNQRRNVKAKSKIPNNAENAQSNQSPTPSEIIANIKIFCWLVKNTSSSATVCGGEEAQSIPPKRKYNILRSNFLTSF